MACSVCGRNRTLCGAEFHPERGTYLSESSCHDGVWMDDDVYGEGWERDVLYPPCPHNPAVCDCIKRDLTHHELHSMSCGVCIGKDDCESCGGSGWKDQKWQWPVSADDLVDATPRPWRAEGPDMFGDYNIQGPVDALAIGAVVTNMRHPAEVAANAELIVRAVNAFEPLVEALEMVRDADEDCKRDGLPTMPPIPRAKIDAALAKARGEQ